MSEDGGLLTRSYGAGPATFAVKCPSAAMRDAVERLFVDLPDSVDPITQNVIVVAEDPDGMLNVSAPDRDAGPASPNEVLAALVTSVSRMALDADPGHLHLHCAALSRNGRGVLISAPSGTGKTTLAAALTLRGWSYLSDEAVALESGSANVSGFPKPILIKPGGGELVPGLSAARVSVDGDDDSWWLVPASNVPAPIVSEFEPSVIVILHRSFDGSIDVEPVPTELHPADAVVALMGQTMDAQRFGPDAVTALSHLAARCRCVSLPVGKLDAEVQVLEDLISSTRQNQHTRTFESTGDGSTHSWRAADGVRSIQIAERVVVHNTAGGTIAALDEAGTAVWRALHDDPPSWWHPETIHTPSTDAFLEQLRAHGLVVRNVVKEPNRA